ncbi:MAG: peptidylprolyl isomerase, partial [Candidatus Omnitrophica bacterium]|nr:peptidylprolyl isomerase [Candidatus Omnitrophota bacterium]
PAVSEKDVAARVDNRVITLQDIDSKISKMPDYYQARFRVRKREVLDDMILEMLLFEEAKKRGLEKDNEVKEMLEEVQKRILISKLIKDEIEEKAKISEREVEEYYKAHLDEFNIPERMKASHILVKTEAEAKAILAELSEGKSFEALAREKSQDTSAKNGGDVGYFAKGQMVSEFEEAASKLEVGQISDVVKSQYGYHIIKLTDKQGAQTQNLKDVSERIKNRLLLEKKQNAFNKLADSLKAKASIKINEELFKNKKGKDKPAAVRDDTLAVKKSIPEVKKEGAVATEVQRSE